MTACVAVLQAPEADGDWELVARTRKGDTSAFAVLFERHRPRAYSLAMRITHNPDAASDVVQEAFFKAYKNLGGFAGNANFFTWLYRIVTNVAIDRYRRAQHALAQDDVVALEARVNHLREPLGLDPEQATAQREAREKISEAAAKLSAVHRMVLVLRDVEGLSYNEIARVMHCPKGTVMSRLFYARRYMRELLVGVGLRAAA